jgi:SAM-dependent methyltransferase
MRADLFKLHADREVRHWWFLGRRRVILAMVDELLPPGRERLVVDVGCGTGANVAALAETRQCVGIDVSSDGIALARQRYPHCEFHVGHAPQDLGELAGRADLFLLMDVLEHVRDDIALLTGIMAAAKPGAFVLITVPADPALWSPHDVTHMHYRRYTYERLQELWDDAGIERVFVGGLNHRLLPLIRLVRALERRRGHALGPGDTDLSMPPAPINRLLSAVFAGEADGLVADLRRRRVDPAPTGVSLLAVLRRGEGPVAVRSRTAALAAQDLNDPEER